MTPGGWLAEPGAGSYAQALPHIPLGVLSTYRKAVTNASYKGWVRKQTSRLLGFPLYCFKLGFYSLIFFFVLYVNKCVASMHVFMPFGPLELGLGICVSHHVDPGN